LSHESCLSVERKRNNRKISLIKESPAKLFFNSTAAIAAYLNKTVNGSGGCTRVPKATVSGRRPVTSVVIWLIRLLALDPLNRKL